MRAMGLLVKTRAISEKKYLESAILCKVNTLTE